MKDKKLNSVMFYVDFISKDLMRRKLLYLIAFTAVFVSILAVLLIDVFVKKGSLIYIKMSEDLPIDAIVKSSMKRAENGQMKEFLLNYTRIEELQETEY